MLLFGVPFGPVDRTVLEMGLFAEKASVIISTDLEFSRWTELFESPTLTAALFHAFAFIQCIIIQCIIILEIYH
jgi:hypothetical protein